MCRVGEAEGRRPRASSRTSQPSREAAPQRLALFPLSNASILTATRSSTIGVVKLGDPAVWEMGNDAGDPAGGIDAVELPFPRGAGDGWLPPAAADGIALPSESDHRIILPGRADGCRPLSADALSGRYLRILRFHLRTGPAASSPAARESTQPRGRSAQARRLLLAAISFRSDGWPKSFMAAGAAFATCADAAPAVQAKSSVRASSSALIGFGTS